MGLISSLVDRVGHIGQLLALNFAVLDHWLNVVASSSRCGIRVKGLLGRIELEVLL